MLRGDVSAGSARAIPYAPAPRLPPAGAEFVPEMGDVAVNAIWSSRLGGA